VSASKKDIGIENNGQIRGRDAKRNRLHSRHHHWVPLDRDFSVLHERFVAVSA